MLSIPRFATWIFAFATISLSATAAEFYVAPGGSDAAAGTREAPFQTLAHARDTVRAARLAQPGQPITVWIGGGDYPLNGSLTFSAADSGTGTNPVVYRTPDGDTARLLGARRIGASQLKPVTDPRTLERMRPSARGKLVELDLSALGVKHAQKLPDVFNDGGSLVDLFFNGHRLPLARFPKGEGTMTMKRVIDNAGGVLDSNWRTPAKVQQVRPGSLGGVFEYRGEFEAEHQRWAAVTDRGVWFKGYWRVAWENEAVRVAAIDPERHTVTFAKPVPGGIGNKYARPAGNGHEAYWVFNQLEECDEPGEWCVDFVDHKLYLYPPAPLETAEIFLADSAEPVVRVAGASHLTLRGLTVEASLGHGIEVDGGEGVLVAGCTVRNVDRYAVVLDGGTRNTVQSCDLYNLGAGGVWLGGGDETHSPRIPAGHRVVNNHIHHFAQIERVYAPGVNCGFTGGGGGGHHPAVGMLVAHNLIHDTPHAGVLFGSWDSTFEFNEVFRYCIVSNDMGAFYCYEQFERGGGQTFRFNLIHSTDDGDGIYFDHDHRDMKLFGNIAFFQSSGGKRGTAFLYKIGSQAKNPQSIDCQNNIAIACRYGGVFVAAKPSITRIANNVSVACNAPWTWSTVDASGRETKSPAGYESGPNRAYASVADAGFIDAAHHDFRLRPDSRIFRDLPGFQQIPVDQIGLYIDEYRRQLPSDDEIDRFNRHPASAGLHYDILDRK